MEILPKDLINIINEYLKPAEEMEDIIEEIRHLYMCEWWSFCVCSDDKRKMISGSMQYEQCYECYDITREHVDHHHHHNIYKGKNKKIPPRIRQWFEDMWDARAKKHF